MPLVYILAAVFEGFAAMMNEKAHSIGMNRSLFVTPSGLDEGNHHSTAYDMAILASNALNNEIFCSDLQRTQNGSNHQRRKAGGL